MAAETQAKGLKNPRKEVDWFYRLGQRLADEHPDIRIEDLLEDGVTPEDLIGLLSDRVKIDDGIRTRRNLDRLQMDQVEKGWRMSVVISKLSDPGSEPA